MADRDSIYRLEKPNRILVMLSLVINVPAKRGRRAKGKKPVLVEVEIRHNVAGFVAMQAVKTVPEKTVYDFL